MPSWTYRDAGVDVARADATVAHIVAAARSTARPEVLAGVGGFGAAVRLPPGRYREPVLISGTDGVGTKLLVALATGRHDTVGIDLVAMCANDILTVGAEPLYFLDYVATGRLDPEVLMRLVDGVAEGCRRAGCALVGGETAELPGLVEANVYDLAGFCVGVVEADAMLGPDRVAPGQAVVAVASSGLHSNGYSLVRRVVADRGYGWSDSPAPLGEPLADALLEPTAIYAAPLAALREAGAPLAALAHITGGGIAGNLVRVLPAGCAATMHLGGFPRPAVFDWLLAEGVAPGEALGVFNLGVGLVALCAADAAAPVVAAFEAAGFAAAQVGRVHAGDRAVEVDLDRRWEAPA